MSFTNFPLRSISAIVFLAFFGLGDAFGQAPVATFVSQKSGGEIAGNWEIQFLNTDKKISLELEQTGRIAIGTFAGAPVIVNIGGNKIKFKCDLKDKRGYRTRYNVTGLFENGKMRGTSMVHSKKDNSFTQMDWEARRVR